MTAPVDGRARDALVFASLVAVGAACADAAPARTRVVVFAAQSLERPLRDVERAVEAARPDLDFAVHAAGSQILVSQIAQGARADVVVTADERTMRQLSDQGLVGSPAIVARNRVALIAPSSTTIASPADLAKPGTKVVVCVEAAPCGAAAKRVLEALGLGEAVARNVVSREDGVAGVVAKVALGEADVGVAYVTDAAASGGALRAIPIPVEADVEVRYPAAVVASSAAKPAAHDVVAFLAGDVGRAAFAAAGFLPP